MRLTPAERFRKYNSEDAAKLAMAVSEPWFMSAASAALAQMAHLELGAELAGANKFLLTLTILPDERPGPKKEPSPHLPSYENKPEQPPEPP